MLRYCTFSSIYTTTWCYATACSLQFTQLRDALQFTQKQRRRQLLKKLKRDVLMQKRYKNARRLTRPLPGGFNPSQKCGCHFPSSSQMWLEKKLCSKTHMITYGSKSWCPFFDTEIAGWNGPAARPVGMTQQRWYQRVVLRALKYLNRLSHPMCRAEVTLVGDFNPSEKY